MAKPPEPLQEILPRAALIVEAEVVEVLETGEAPPAPDAPQGYTSAGHQVASQLVELKVTRSLKGEASGDRLRVHKPVAAYGLRAGNHGPFLLEGEGDSWTIIGRYGPDSYKLSLIERALQAG